MMVPSQLPLRKLGKNGPSITAIGYGCMGLSAFYGSPKPDTERYAFLDHIYNAGEHFWDTADMYGDSEDLLGRWFKKNPGKRENIFLATKFGNFVDPHTGKVLVKNSPEYIGQAIEKSLNRLMIDYVDLYYVHRLDRDQPIEITVRAMKKLQDAGKIRYLGLSECSADSLRRACKVAHIDAIQMEYSPFSLEIEDPQYDLLRTAQELGVAVIAYSPLGRGFLTGSIKSRSDFAKDDFRSYAPRFNEENFPMNLKLVESIKAVADQKGCTPAQLVLAFLLAQGDHIFPIPGTTSTKNFDENIGALKVSLTDEEDTQIRDAIAATEVRGDRYPAAFGQSLFVDTVPLRE